MHSRYPATNRLTVNAKLEKFDDGFAIWELISGQGRKVMSGSITPEVLQNGFDLDLSEVNSVVYFFLYTENNLTTMLN